MPKFFVKTQQIEGNSIKIVGEDVKHITHVLRMTKGEEITICDTQSNLNYLAEIKEIRKEFVLCTILDCMKSVAESNIKVTVFQGMPKADKMEYIIQKVVELGAQKIVPVTMQRSVVKLDTNSAEKKLQRWQKIAETAAKQSGRDIIPQVENLQKVSDICQTIKNYDLVLLAYENEQKTTLKQELQKWKVPSSGGTIGIIIGPEGGIDKKEIEEFIEAGAKPVTLGKRILRTETASIAIISNIIYEYEM